jgi:diguanylate cyclase (GGDEF)-like protein/PAS domain S-box-containing protein
MAPKQQAVALSSDVFRGLVENQSELTAFLDLFGDLVCVVRDGRVVFINRGGARLLGAPQTHLVGRAVTDFLATPYTDLAADGFSAVLDECASVPVCLRGIEGQSIEVELTVRPFSFAGPAVILTARDVTTRLRAAEAMVRSEARFRRVIDLALDFTCICRGDAITYMNAAGLKLLAALHPNEVVGRRFETLLHGEYAALTADGLAMLAAEKEPIPVKFRALDGRSIDVEVAVVSLGDGQEDFMIEARDMSERKRAAQSVVEREQRLRGVMNAVADGILTVAEGGEILTANPAAEGLLGWSAGELTGHDVMKWMLSRPGESRRDTIRRYRDLGLARVDANARVVEACRKDGSRFPAELTVSEVRFGEERVFIIVMRDVTERQEHEQAILRARDQLEIRVAERTRELADLTRQTLQILNATSEAILGVDGEGRISFINPAVDSILGWKTDQLLGKAWAKLAADFQPLEGGEGGDVRDLFAAARTALAPVRSELAFLRRGSDRIVVEATVAPIVESGNWQGAVIVVTDITQRKLDERELKLLATTDSLTGASNRRHFLELSHNEVGRARRYGRALSVVMFDVDHFKRVNDTHGHDAGDEVLRALAGICQREKRVFDIFGRLGGEEFAFTLPDTDRAGARGFCERLRQRIGDLGIRLADGTQLGITISLGAASLGEIDLAGTDGALDALIKLSDSRLYQAKTGGRNRAVVD